MTDELMGLRLPGWIVTLTCGVFTTTTMAFLDDALETMIPWILVMLGVVTADLIAGIRKSLKLGIHVSWSMAFRNTMGKMVTYVAFVMMVALIDAACGHQFRIAMWSCLFVCLLEGGSIVSNLMKPYGVDITPGNILQFAVRVFSSKVIRMDGMGSLGDDETMEEIREHERGRWERRERNAKRYRKGTGD